MRHDRVVITTGMYLKEASFSAKWASPQVGEYVIHMVCEGKPLMFAATREVTRPRFESRNQLESCLMT